MAISAQMAVVFQAGIAPSYGEGLSHCMLLHFRLDGDDVVHTPSLDVFRPRVGHIFVDLQ
jgi:hypothetical protein